MCPLVLLHYVTYKIDTKILSMYMSRLGQGTHRVGPDVALGLGLRHAPHAARQQQRLHLSLSVFYLGGGLDEWFVRVGRQSMWVFICVHSIHPTHHHHGRHPHPSLTNAPASPWPGRSAPPAPPAPGPRAW